MKHPLDQACAYLSLVLLLLFVLSACRPQADDLALAPIGGAAPFTRVQQEAAPLPTQTASLLARPQTPTPTLHPAVTRLQLPTPAIVATPTTAARITSEPTIASDIVLLKPYSSPTPPPLCAERFPDSDLFTLVTLEYGLSRDAVPDDLVLLSDHLPYSVTVGYPSEIRSVALQPLVTMINDMLADGLQPWILSGYRSYAAQAIAWNKWNTLYPDRAHILSAPPGHSEHQLGTVIDFGSPELASIVGDVTIQFHTYFAQTSEGKWLAENAHKYGFTLSYTLEAFETTGFYYEPWHYRYVGVPLATQLAGDGLTFTEYKLANELPPCIP